MMKKTESQFFDDLEFILNAIGEYYPHLNNRQRKKISTAFTFAESAHLGQFRESGEPYFAHPIAATKILLKINPDIDTICACLLHDVIEDTSVVADDVEECFGPEVRFLCEGVEKIAQVRISEHDKDEKKVENIQKLFVAMAQDIRVIFVKLADRIHNLETLQYVKPEKRERIARESIEIYAPVADKFGLYEFKFTIEGACFKHLHPKEYQKLSKQLLLTKQKRKKFIENAKKEILKKMQESGIKTDRIEARQKDLYSIFKKMRRKKSDNLDDIYDVLGVRIIIGSNEDCYRVLGTLHAHWRPIPNRFKDYIALPKPNGYQSLHTTVLGLGQNTLPTEIQIRTIKMDMDARYGPAAHWAYKKTGHSNFDEDYTQKTSWVPRQITAKKDQKADEFFREISDAIFSERIYVFTPKGDVLFFPKGSTPVDFAYGIHSDIGESCVGVKINGIIKPLNYELKNSDVVSIMIKKGRHPNPLWLHFVRTSSAKDKIKNFLRKQSYDFPEEPNPQEKVIEELKVKQAIEKKILPLPKKRSERKIVIGGEMDLNYTIAKCCSPKKSDEIIAYKNLGKSFSIHHQGCKELENLDPNRFYEAYLLIPKRLTVLLADKPGVFFKISEIISGHHINIYSIRSKRNIETETLTLHLVLHVHSESEYADMIQKISRADYFVQLLKQ